MGNRKTSAICDQCRRPVDGTAYVCTRCGVELATRHLRTVADLTPDARAAAAGQARHTTGVGGTGAVRLELDLPAASRLDAIQSELTTWARTVHDERGGAISTGDPIVVSALYLAEHLEWLRHQRQAAEALRIIAACARLITSIVDGPGERVIVGACECGTMIYARPTAEAVTCRQCGRAWDVTRSRDVLMRHLDGMLLTAAEIAGLAVIQDPTRDRQRIRKLINVWSSRGSARGGIDPQGRSTAGDPLYRVGEVLSRVTASPSRAAA